MVGLRGLHRSAPEARGRVALHCKSGVGSAGKLLNLDSAPEHADAEHDKKGRSDLALVTLGAAACSRPSPSPVSIDAAPFATALV